MSKDKAIYTLPDQSKSYDPMALRRSLRINSGNKLNEWISLYNDALDELDKLKAEENLVQVTRSAFGLKPLVEQGGVADATVLEYLAHYLEWLSQPLNLNTEPSPISRPCTGCLKKKLITEQSVGGNSI